MREGIRKAVVRARGERELRVLILDLSPVIGERPSWHALFWILGVHGLQRALCLWKGTGAPLDAKPPTTAHMSHLPLGTGADIDASAVHTLSGIIDQLKAEGLKLGLVNPSQQVCARQLAPLPLLPSFLLLRMQEAT